MRIRRLGWAGFEVAAQGESLVIDLLQTPEGLFSGTGLSAPLPEVVPLIAKNAALAGLCTHLHRDHTDAEALRQALTPEGIVLHPASIGGDDQENFGLLKAEKELAESGLRRREVSNWEVLDIGPFRIAAIPAVDTLGDPQVSWVVEADNQRLIHLGDTMFHGYWWRAAHRHGPFDAVLTPINGPTVSFPHAQPASPFPATLDAEHAAVAARLLRAKMVVPMHYEGFHLDGFYHTVRDELARFLEASQGEEYRVEVLTPGQSLQL
ncbi:MBL fold metallo-hydrolase [Psychromicrobium lacuslunae]|uniref:Metal-dependent hydrolase n=1 Tax=Psychromicrobium lacuslunae TaxID=1618207 RepID=A0A0D4C132_9MICC|nr:MBL fold metallo-hydrolase [Psychromicrobium lacuslunae]AJT42046.1 metal-dependent hydrolase [Psychromicrobium lacuslunae]